MMHKINFKLIMGLGNPGKEYKETYHNVGDLFVKFLEGKTAAKTFRASETQTFMNEIGKEVLKATRKSGIKPEQILIAHDDADIELGHYKISFSSGSAGHKGVESIIKSLGTKDFWRLRIGIGQPAPLRGALLAGKKIKAGKIVLKKITSSDWKKILETFEKIAAEID